MRGLNVTVSTLLRARIFDSLSCIYSRVSNIHTCTDRMICPLVCQKVIFLLDISENSSKLSSELPSILHHASRQKKCIKYFKTLISVRYDYIYLV